MAPAEESMRLAAAIPGARLVLLDGTTQLGDADQGIKAIEEFLADSVTGAEPDTASVAPALSSREGEVLPLFAGRNGHAGTASELAMAPRSTPRRVYPGGLTKREVEVVRLVAAGRSNAQIADELVISPSTVAKHVTSILGKIGAANRAQAAVYAKDHGLL